MKNDKFQGGFSTIVNSLKIENNNQDKEKNKLKIRKNKEKEKENEKEKEKEVSPSLYNYIPHTNEDTLTTAFKDFVEHLPIFERKEKTISKTKNDYFQKEWEKNQIYLTEIAQFNYQNPIELLNESYIKEEYNKYLLSDEIKEIEKITSLKIAEPVIFKKQEKLMLTKTILDKFLSHYVNQKFIPIISSLNKLYLTEHNVKSCLEVCHDTKIKMHDFKIRYMKSTTKFLLSKQKLKNLEFIKQICQETLQPIKKKLDEINNRNSLSNLSFDY